MPVMWTIMCTESVERLVCHLYVIIWWCASYPEQITADPYHHHMMRLVNEPGPQRGGGHLYHYCRYKSTPHLNDLPFPFSNHA